MDNWKAMKIPSVSVDGGNVVHVVPVDDLIRHHMEPKCVCGPWVEKVPGNPAGWLFTHHSLDGRENDE